MEKQLQNLLFVKSSCSFNKQFDRYDIVDDEEDKSIDDNRNDTSDFRLTTQSDIKQGEAVYSDCKRVFKNLQAHKNANNIEIERMLREMNRLMMDSSNIKKSLNDESKWFGTNQLDSF